MKFLVGGYTADMDGRASGIGMLRAGAPGEASAGGALGFAGDVAAVESPSWLAPHPRLDVVYAALEKRGAVQAYRRTGETSWVPLGGAVPAGEAVCHLALAPDGRSLVASCWGDGRVVRMTTDALGAPSSPVIAPAASDPYDPYAPDAAESGAVELRRASGLAGESGAADLAAAARALREAAGSEHAHLVPDDDEPGPDDEAMASDSRPSRAHDALFLPGGWIATTDLGLDLVRLWRVRGGELRSAQQVVLPRGCGPRHMVWHPSGHLYVVAESSCEVFVLAPSADGTWHLIGGTPLGAGTLPGDTAAEIALSRDAEFVYAGVRGSNTIATLRVRGAGEAVYPTALVDAGVHWPRHHVVVRDILLIAGQRSDEVASLTLDVRTGVPGRVRHRTGVPTPTCLLPVR